MAAKLFLGGVSPNTTTEMIESHFSKYGTVVDAVVMYKDGKHRGFGFVTFDNHSSMNAALSEEQIIDNRSIDVKPAVPQGEAQAPPPRRPQGGYGGGGGGHGPVTPRADQAAKLFLGGITPNTTTEMIEHHFSKYGTITDAVVMYKDGKHRGFGFVTFDNHDSMNAALSEEQIIDNRVVDVKPAVPQGDMSPGFGGNHHDNGRRPMSGGKGGMGGKGGGYGGYGPPSKGYGGPGAYAAPAYGYGHAPPAHYYGYGPYGHGPYGGGPYAGYGQPQGGGYGGGRGGYRPRPY